MQKHRNDGITVALSWLPPARCPPGPSGAPPSWKLPWGLIGDRYNAAVQQIS